MGIRPRDLLLLIEKLIESLFLITLLRALILIPRRAVKTF